MQAKANLTSKAGTYELLLRSRTPGAVATLHGYPDSPDLVGEVAFYPTPIGIFVCAEVSGLPEGNPKGKKAESFDLAVGETTLSSLDGRSGHAWRVTATGFLHMSELVGKCLTLRRRPVAGQFPEPIGSGRILPAGCLL